MEKTTKKKKSKRLKRRIGIIAVGGLSLVLTICLSVGATLAWFAGSTWASNDLYMGGPVYVEMAGRSQTGVEDDKITDSGKWVAGDGKLDIIASARSTGTVSGNQNNQILLPGQKLLIYSQARVFSTLYYDSTDSGIYPNQSSGSTSFNTSNGTATYTDSKGRIKTATTSVLRAKFSIKVEFDPSVGFNNFTHKEFANNYPVQSDDYKGDNKENLTGSVAWYDALNKDEWSTTNETPYVYRGIKPAHYDDIGNVDQVYVADADATDGDDDDDQVYDVVTPDDADIEFGQAEKWTTGTGANNKWYHPADANHDYVVTTAENTNAEEDDKITGLTADLPYFLAYKITYAGRRDAVVGDAAVKFIGGTLYNKTDDVKEVGQLTMTDPTYNANGEQAGDEGYTPPAEQYTALQLIRSGERVSIFKWKYVSQKEYLATDAVFRMGTPFDGTINSAGGQSNVKKEGNQYVANPTGSGNGYYGVWVGAEGQIPNPDFDDSADPSESNPLTISGPVYEESEAFYKARTEAYLKSYNEHYVDEYGRPLELSVGEQLSDLEDALNDSFTNLVNQSSDRILAGYVDGFEGDADGALTYGGVAANVLDVDDDDYIDEDEGIQTEGKKVNATWLYVDPKIGNDINAGASSTDVGGWWYLVESDTGTVTSGKNAVKTEVDVVAGVSRIADEDDVANKLATYAGQTIYDWSAMTTASKNEPAPSGQVVSGGFMRGAVDTFLDEEDDENPDNGLITHLPDNDYRILHAKLYEVAPNLITANGVGHNNGTTKVVSVSFPFVNGNFELPGKELTNIFANAKISFQISFQALQAFFPYTPSIDGLPAGSALAGKAKALNIENAIPIFNEAFDYLGYLSK